MSLQKSTTELFRVSAFLIIFIVAQPLQAQNQVLGPEEKLYKNKISALQNYGDSAAAITIAQEYVSVIRQKYGPVNMEMSKALYSLGHAFFTDGRYRQAEKTLKQALSIREQLNGVTHVDLIPPLELLATVYYAMLEFDKADVIKERVSKLNGN